MGINVYMPVSDADARIDQPWTDLSSQLPDCSRNELAVLLLEELLEQLDIFAKRGFVPFRKIWQKLDVLEGKSIEVWSGDSSVQGIAKGIDDFGALRLDIGGEVLSFHSGEVSLRRPDDS